MWNGHDIDYSYGYTDFEYAVLMATYDSGTGDLVVYEGLADGSLTTLLTTTASVSVSGEITLFADANGTAFFPEGYFHGAAVYDGVLSTPNLQKAAAYFARRMPSFG